MTDELQILTASSARCFRRCNREFYLRYEQGFAPVAEAPALRFGTLIHKALEAWWRAPAGDERRQASQAALLPEPGVEVEPFDQVRAQELMLGYHLRWDAEPIEVLGVEEEFVAPLVNPETGHPSKTFEQRGKLDVRVRRDDGRVWLIEHKTSSDDITYGSPYWRRLQIDDQISIYLAGARKLGEEVAGCLYDVIGKPGLRPSHVPITDEQGVKIVLDSFGQRVRTKDGKKFRETGDSAQGFVLQTRDETPDEFRARYRAAIVANPNAVYQRGEVVRIGDEEIEAAFDAWQIAKTIREAQRLNRWPRNAQQCVGFGGRTCSYFDACCKVASLDDTTRFKRKPPHSELSLTLNGESL